MQQTGLAQFETAMASISALDPEGAGADGLIQRALKAARTHLGLQVAYLSEFVGNDTVFRHVDAPGLDHLIKPGDQRSLDDVYCRHILAGKLPALIADTAQVPLAAGLPITAAVPIGAHVSVPIRLSTGEVYGMFCCLGPLADPTLNDRDLNVLRCFADMASTEVERNLARDRKSAETRRRIEDIIAGQGLAVHYQPIWDIASRRAVGFEALARFDGGESRSPADWFADAHRVGLGHELELLAIRRAIEGLDQLPADSYLTVNSSPATAITPELTLLLQGAALDRLVLEITEHDAIEDTELLSEVLQPLRERGLRIAVDDAGAGYSGLQQILSLQPDIIKLDRYFVRSIDDDPVRRALAAALADFSRSIGCTIVGEGVETAAELATLQEIGFEKVQGYLLGRPAPLERLDVERPGFA